MNHLRHYQTEAISNLRKAFAKGFRKALLVAPTGSGKTVIASALIKQAIKKGSKVLFVAHRRGLIMQCSRKLYDFGINHGVIMAGKSPSPNHEVQVVSIQTFNARKDNNDFDWPDADIIILDEAHRSTSKTFTSLINDYKESIIIGLTATPMRSDHQGLGSVYDTLVVASDIKKLTEQKYLVPIRYIAPHVPDVESLKIVAGDYEKKGLEKKMNVPKLIGNIVEHWKVYASERPTVVFGTSINHSKQIAKAFNAQGVAAGHIDGEMDETDREEQLELYKKGKIRVLSNCQILQEGWDSPHTSCVILARPTRSKVMFLQMIGRILRPYINKQDSMVIDHAGAIYTHGWPDEQIDWTLETTEVSLRKAQAQSPAEKEPFTCVECNYVYRPTKDNPECPNCAFMPTKKTKEILTKQGRLKEIKKETTIDKKRFLAEVRYYGLQKGFKPGWSSWVYKEKFGHFPKRLDVKPIITSEEVLGYIKHYYIKTKIRRDNQVKILGGNIGTTSTRV